MENVYGIEYSKPEVVLLQDTGIGVAEAAARTCYDSFENSENEVIKNIENQMPDEAMCDSINSIEDSNLLDDLAWTYFHHSILEHANLSSWDKPWCSTRTCTPPYSGYQCKKYTLHYELYYQCICSLKEWR